MSGWGDLVRAGLARPDEPLAAHTTYKLGGPVAYYVVADRMDDLRRVAAALAAEPLPVLVVGRGSNLLVADEGFPGVVVTLGQAFSWVSVDETGMAASGGSTPLPRLARVTAEQGRGGLEWCVGVPGSVGGGVRQNAGCFGAEIVDSLEDADVIDVRTGTARRRSADSLDLAYRHSNIAATEVVVAARFRTHPVDPEAAKEEMKRITRWRRDHQPGGTLNAGSVFKNPPSEPAGAIIDRLGLKGHSVGRVRVSERHANFIEADAGASARDVARLIESVRHLVAERAGVELEPEIQLVGFEEWAHE